MKLSETLNLVERKDGFWLYDTTRGMNLSMRAKTQEQAFTEALMYYQKRTIGLENKLKQKRTIGLENELKQKRTIGLENELKTLREAIDSFIATVRPEIEE